MADVRFGSKADIGTGTCITFDAADSGSLAIFAAIRRALSGVTKVTAQVRTAK